MASLIIGADLTTNVTTRASRQDSFNKKPVEHDLAGVIAEIQQFPASFEFLSEIADSVNCEILLHDAAHVLLNVELMADAQVNYVSRDCDVQRGIERIA